MNTKRGFTLIEIIVAAVILATAVAGLWASFIAAQRYTTRARVRIMAMNAAREVLEDLRKDVRADTWNTGRLAMGNHAFALTGAFTAPPYNGTASYTVSVPDPNGVPDLAANCRKVQLTIHWDDIN